MKILQLLLVSFALSGVTTFGQNKSDIEKMDMAKIMSDLNSWPTASRMAATEIMEKYGKPDIVSPEMLAWKDKGPWKTIHIDKQETKHSFPIEHTDMMKQTIQYDIPLGKFDDLAKFDGSVILDRTQGLMSARCDKEANNFLALNLANDIVTGKKSVVEARKAFGDIVKEKMNGGNPLYMQRLTFTPIGDGDPDKNTTGFTKETITKSEKTAKN